MNASHILDYQPQHRNYPLPEGLRLGLIAGTATWLWIALVDIAFGQPFHTFELLGGIVAYTAVHYLLNIVCWVAVVAAVRGADRTPSAVFGLIFCLIILEVAVAMIANLLAEHIGSVAWVGIFGGSLIASAIGIVLLARAHPLVQYLHVAEEEM